MRFAVGYLVYLCTEFHAALVLRSSFPDHFVFPIFLSVFAIFRPSALTRSPQYDIWGCMFTSEAKELTDLARVFLEPTNATHRQYEALRAFFVDGLPSAEAARRFGYTPGSFRVLVHQFRQNPRRAFFLTPAKGPQSAPKSDPLRDRVIALRKQNLSIYDISRNLAHQGHPLSPVAVAQILKDEGFARLPRRADDERPPGSRPTTADVADVRQLDLSPQSFRTKFGGLFLFLPMLAAIPLDRILQDAGFPGSEMIPAGCALRSLLALKLFGTARHGHVMSVVLDQGLALFAGLERHPQAIVLDRVQLPDRPDLLPGADAPLVRRREPARSAPRSFLRPGFPHHPLPWRGCPDREALRLQAEPTAEGHPGLPGPRRRRPASSATPTANCARTEQNDEILRFVRFWKERTGRYPEELIFDSKLTTYAKLNELNRLGIQFITLRRRSPRARCGRSTRRPAPRGGGSS